MRRPIFAAAVIASTLSACASDSDSVISRIVWRAATVLDVGAARDFGPPTDFDCRPAHPDDGSDARFAMVRYTLGKGFHRRIVPIAPDQTVHVGDTIRISLTGCRTAPAYQPAPESATSTSGALLAMVGRAVDSRQGIQEHQ